MFSVGGNALAVFLLSFFFSLAEAADSRTIEFPFALSADARSEFSASFQVFSAGRIVIEGVWNVGAYPLHIALVRPDGSEAARREGHSALRLEYAIAEAEADKFNSDSPARWNVKITNSAAPERSEVSGKLRLTIPTTPRTLEDTQYTLLGHGNAQEIPIRIIAPGRVTVEAEWQNDSPAENEAALLTLSLEHPGTDRIYARRTAKSPLRIEQQITAADIERGKRVVVRLQNDNTARVRGRVKVTFTPAL
ncbi:MAG TPA: hypothetical protein VKS99_05375 [Blastocatellia bacterium]|nr:hypothetical protein [Blastocatellia bacterium]